MSLNHSSSARRVQPRAVLLCAAVVLVTACQSDGVLAPPNSGSAADIQLAASSRQLVSFGDTVRLEALVRNASGGRTDNVPLRWQLSVANVLESLGNGQFRAIGNGRVTIVASMDPSATGVRPRGYYADAIADSITIDVQQVPALVHALSVDTLYAMVGLKRAVQLRVADARGHNIDNTWVRLTYEMVDTRIATVDSAGVIISRAEGNTEVRAIARTAAGAATWSSPITVRPRSAHTSCMTFTQRRRARASCVKSDFVVHAPVTVTP